MSYTLIGFIVYLIIVLIIGFLTYRINKSHKDFFIADRRLNPWVTAFSERASGESAWLLLGLPGAAYAFGLIEVWTALGCILGIIFYWFAIARSLRVESEKADAITLPTFFAEKAGIHQKVIRIIATSIIIFFFSFYLAAQFNGAGKVLNVTFNISYTAGMVIGAFVIIFYTMMGGFFAVAWTDFFQGIIMFAALVILPIFGFIELKSHHIQLLQGINNSGINFLSFTSGKTGWAGTVLIISGLSWAFGYMGQPHLLTRFMAIKSPEQIKKGRIIAFSWAIPAFTGAMAIGLIGLALKGNNYFPDVENVMPFLANELMPAWLAGILISGAIAAMMSTADSQLLVISSSFIEDIYHKTFRKDVSDKTLLNLSRIVTIIVGIAGFTIAITSKKLIFSLVSYAWAGLGSSFGPALLLLLKWKKTTAQGVIAGMITGAVSTIIWSNIHVLDNTISVRFASFVFAFMAVIIGSLLTQKKE